MSPMPNFTERRNKDRAFVPPTSLVAPATMAVVDPATPDVERCCRGGPCHRVTAALAIALDAVACPPTCRHCHCSCRRRHCPFRRPPPSPTLVAVTITHHPLRCHRHFPLYCRLGGEPTGEPTRNDLMVDKAGTKKQQRHHQQLTNSSTILKTFTLPVSLD